MTYVITDACVDVKDRSCVQECPVDCIKDGGSQLFINPDDCIDCGACEPVCPVDAIYYEDDVPENKKVFIELNKSFFTSPNR
jgi:ferredoxin